MSDEPTSAPQPAAAPTPAPPQKQVREWRKGWRTPEEKAAQALAKSEAAKARKVFDASPIAVARGEMLRLVKAEGIRKPNLTDEQNEDFQQRLALALEKIAMTGDIRDAARNANLSMMTLMRARVDFPAFDKLWAIAEQVVVEALYETEIGKRAMAGADDRGSIAALTKILESRRPQRYGKHVNVTGALAHTFVSQTILPSGVRSRFKDIPGREVVNEDKAPPAVLTAADAKKQIESAAHESKDPD